MLLVGVWFYLAPRLGYQWDFETFYYAAAALRRGLDPYHLDVLSAVAGKPVPLPFLYPPATLALFLPLTWLPVQAAATVWLGLKLALAVALIALWWSRFLRATSLTLLLLVAIFGFNAAIVVDIRVGNVSILEQLLLWLAFGFYLQDRRWPFAFLVAAASVFKLLPIVFLALLLVPSKRHGSSPGPALVGLVLFSAVVFLPTALGLGWAQGFLGNVPAARSMGEFNPCALGVFDMLLGQGLSSGGGASTLALVLWMAYCATLLASSRQAVLRVWRARDPLQSIVVGSMLFALLAPRMMAYSYALLVVPALLLVRWVFPRVRDQGIALAFVVIQGLVMRSLLRADFLRHVVRPPALAEVVLTNLPFFVVLGLWVSFLNAKGRLTPRHESQESALGRGSSQRPLRPSNRRRPRTGRR